MDTEQDILDRLFKLGDKWRWAQPEINAICTDAIYQIKLLQETNKILLDTNGKKSN